VLPTGKDDEEAQQPGEIFFLLYLKDGTFVGEAGAKIVEQLRLLLSPSKKRRPRMLLIHENDITRGGCAFGRFFETTPEDLVSAGLYSDIAVAFHEEPFRQVSLVLAAQKMGAVADSSAIRRRLARVARWAKDARWLGARHCKECNDHKQGV